MYSKKPTVYLGCKGIGLLNLRLIINLGLDQLKETVEKYKLENGKDISEMGLDENGQYCSDDYRTVYHLETNFKKRDAGDRFRNGLGAVFLTKLLLETSFFGLDIDASEPSARKDIILVGTTIFTQLMSIPCNSFGVTELQINPRNCKESHFESIGAAVYPACSLLNHSCDSPTLANFCGKKLVIRANRSIPKGKEITVSYGPMFDYAPANNRKQFLSNKYYFECSCIACIDSWPQYSSLHSYPNVKETTYFFCPFCKEKVNPSKHKCKGTALRPILANIMQKIKTMGSKFDQITLETFNPEVEPLILDAISSLQKYVVLPNRLFFLCQENLRFCFDFKSNHWVID